MFRLYLYDDSSQLYVDDTWVREKHNIMRQSAVNKINSSCIEKIYTEIKCNIIVTCHVILYIHFLLPELFTMVGELNRRLDD